MKLSDIIDYILLETGNYIVSDLVKEEINITKFSILTKSVLGEYTNYRPRRDTRTIYIERNPYIFKLETAPITIDQVSNSFIRAQNRLENELIDPTPNKTIFREHIPVLHYWKYEKPILYVNYMGLIYIVGNFNYTITAITENNIIVDYSLPEIDFSNTEFFKLLSAKFLMTVGKQRRAFTANDLPISTDASDLVSEGKELWDSTIEILRQNSAWWTII